MRSLGSRLLLFVAALIMLCVEETNALLLAKDRVYKGFIPPKITSSLSRRDYTSNFVVTYQITRFLIDCDGFFFVSLLNYTRLTIRWFGPPDPDVQQAIDYAVPFAIIKPIFFPC
jgi:hypothetical protein